MSRKLKVVSGILMICIFIVILCCIPRNQTDSFKEKYSGTADLEKEVGGIGRENTYTKYLEAHKDSLYPTEDIEVDITKYSGSTDIKLLEEYEGEKEVLYTLEDSFAQWQVNVPAAGMYQVYIRYFPVKSRGVDIERKFYINGKIPFLGADTIGFTRLWRNAEAIRTDNQGNDIKPSQIDAPAWTGEYFKDDLGYFTKPYTFYFEKGLNTIGLESVNEPMIIKSLTLRAVNQDKPYVEYIKDTSQVTPSDTALHYKQVVQGEEATLRSSPSLYPLYDRSSPTTVPYSVSKIRLNMIGGNAWRISGQWIEWKFNIPEDGYYYLGVKSRQNYNRGFVSNRTVYIDGAVPFKELEQIPFRYSNEWIFNRFSNEEDTPYKFYLSQGEHALRMEVTLGDMGYILNEMQDSVYRLNSIYRKILVLTGTTPDKYRDYKIDKVYPEIIESMDLESKRLYKIIDEIVAYSGEKTNQVASIQTLASQLETFVKNPSKIPGRFTNFKDNISAIGTSILNLSEAPLDIDYLTVTGIKEDEDIVKDTLLKSALHEIKSFAASFTTDYNAVGDVYDRDEAIQVWILSGRDQSTILKSMIDDTYTPSTGIKVNVKLVEAGTLLNAIIAGKGPDVVISAGQGEPVNYALRNAVEDLTQFPDYKEVLKNFKASAYTPYQFEGGIYALPETQNFNVMFYRKDILEELKIEVPNTWEDLIAILPIIQQNNMSVAIPSTERTLNNVSNPDLSSLFAMLYQNGGTVYDEAGKRTVIDSEYGSKAFESMTKLFTQYKLPTIYDFPNLFRSGQMPLGIADYSTFNTLVVFAPEIRGLWDFTVIPGTLKEDGTVDRSCHTSGLCTLMLKTKDDNTRNNSWNFMKWWVSTQTQVRFGQEMESVMGASARYATANINAFEQLSWSKEQLKVLKEQWDWTVGLREVAGGYYTQRHITNAIRKVLNRNEDPRETLLDYATTIDLEIEKKRLEFGLDEKQD
jgi:ABC-type glycerol-3-phosphate transport system substrate-binding protein